MTRPTCRWDFRVRACVCLCVCSSSSALFDGRQPKCHLRKSEAAKENTWSGEGESHPVLLQLAWFTLSQSSAITAWTISSSREPRIRAESHFSSSSSPPAASDRLNCEVDMQPGTEQQTNKAARKKKKLESRLQYTENNIHRGYIGTAEAEMCSGHKGWMLSYTEKCAARSQSYDVSKRISVT